MTLATDSARNRLLKRFRRRALLVGAPDSFSEARRALARDHAETIVVTGEAAIVAAGWPDIEPHAGDAELMILTAPPASRAAARAAVSRAAAAGLRTAMLEAGALRDMALDDLIGRPGGEIDWTRIAKLIAGKRILVTGGGGSIGGELTRRLARLKPARLCVLDSSEFNLYEIGRDAPDASVAICDIRDAAAVRRWMARERPDLVFHAAALKQVPLVEAHASEGVLTNVLGCRHVAEAAAAAGADVVFVSTDKAVDPSSVMGASKRLAEMLCQAMDRTQALTGGPRVIVARLGNVLGSAGSVAPLFERQLAAGGPLTITDANVTRYFITIPQAADFLLQAAAAGLAPGAARGAACVLDMGEPLSVLELAHDIILLAGLRPQIDVPIDFVGLRPGEKLNEALVASDEWRLDDLSPGVMAIASPPRGLADLHERIDRLILLAQAGADQAVTAALHEAAAPIGATGAATRAQARRAAEA